MPLVPVHRVDRPGFTPSEGEGFIHAVGVVEVVNPDCDRLVRWIGRDDPPCARTWTRPFSKSRLQTPVIGGELCGRHSYLPGETPQRRIRHVRGAAGEPVRLDIAGRR